MTLLMTLVTVGDCHISTAHYGTYGGLGMSCRPHELILVESELLGYSATPGCNPRPMCSVPYTITRWYCRGKSACWGMQVERRPLRARTCGSMFTNCLRVKYRCVPGESSQTTHLCLKSCVSFCLTNAHLKHKFISHNDVKT